MDLENYRGIHLLSSFLKITTAKIQEKLKEIINIFDVQQGFRTGRSCTSIDDVFIIKQDNVLPTKHNSFRESAQITN